LGLLSGSPPAAVLPDRPESNGRRLSRSNDAPSHVASRRWAAQEDASTDPSPPSADDVPADVTETTVTRTRRPAAGRRGPRPSADSAAEAAPTPEEAERDPAPLPPSVPGAVRSRRRPVSTWTPPDSTETE